MDIHTDLKNYVANKINAQRYKWRNIIALPLITIAPGGVSVTPVSINLPSDGYFELLAVTGAFTVPVGETPQCAVRFSDSSGNGNDLTEGFVDLDLILSPGPAGEPLRTFYKFNYIFQPNSTLRADFINRSPATPVDVKIAFHGRKYRV